LLPAFCLRPRTPRQVRVSANVIGTQTNGNLRFLHCAQRISGDLVEFRAVNQNVLRRARRPVQAQDTPSAARCWLCSREIVCRPMPERPLSPPCRGHERAVRDQVRLNNGEQESDQPCRQSKKLNSSEIQHAREREAAVRSGHSRRHNSLIDSVLNQKDWPVGERLEFGSDSRTAGGWRRPESSGMKRPWGNQLQQRRVFRVNRKVAAFPVAISGEDMDLLVYGYASPARVQIEFAGLKKRAAQSL